MMKRSVFAILLSLVVVGICFPASGASMKNVIGINIVLNTDITQTILADLGTHGKVRDVLYKINALTIQAPAGQLDAIRALPYVAAAGPDTTRNGGPIDTVPAADFSKGLSPWDMDVVNVTDYGSTNRQLAMDGTGVYVAVLDTGLLDSWRQYFPQERIAREYAVAFAGGGGDMGYVSSQPNKWEHDQNSHGTHVISTILGYSMQGTPISGVAPKAKVIPVKVLNQNGSGWSSVIARGIVYVADLKTEVLEDAPVVINMSLGGSVMDPLEKAAIDYAISKGVIVVASAGNRGELGMGFPGAYEPVISVAASGWVGEWTSASWWLGNVPDPTLAENFYIGSFSSRQKPGQDLDVAAPGTWTVGPYQMNSGQTSYYFLSGTSMASPHVAGIIALMLQKNRTLTADEAETILENAAIPLPAGCRTVNGIDGTVQEICWDEDASGWGLITADAALTATP